MCHLQSMWMADGNTFSHTFINAIYLSVTITHRLSYLLIMALRQFKAQMYLDSFSFNLMNVLCYIVYLIDWFKCKTILLLFFPRCQNTKSGVEVSPAVSELSKPKNIPLFAFSYCLVHFYAFIPVLDMFYSKTFVGLLIYGAVIHWYRDLRD